MTSTNSSYKPKSKLGIQLAETAKRHFPGAAAAFVIALIACLYTYIVNDVTYVQDQGDIDLTSSVLLLSVFMFFGVALYNLIAVLRMYSEIFSKQASDYYFARPVSRMDIFNANFIFGSISTVVILAVPLLLYYFVSKAPGSENINFVINSSLFFNQLAVIICSSLAVFAVFTLCAVASGKKIQYFLLAFIALVSTAVAAVGAAEKIGNIWGIRINSAQPPVVSPLYNYSQTVTGDYSSVILAIVELVILYIAGTVVFKKRKAECAQVSLAGDVFPCIVLAVFILSGFMLPAFYGSFIKNAVVGLMVAFVFMIIYNAVFYKKAFTKKSTITFGAVSAVSLLFFASVFIPSYDGYISYVPEKDEVESVEYICNEYSYYYMDFYSLLDSSLYAEEPTVIEFKDAQNIDKILDFHKKMVSQNTIIQSTAVNGIFETSSEMNVCSCTLVYHLKDGSTVKRSYDANADCVMQEYINLIRSEETLSQLEPFNYGDDIAFIQYEEYSYYEDYNGDTYTSDSANIINIPEDKWDDVLQALMQDRLAESDEELLYTQSFSYLMGYDDVNVPDTKGYISFALYSDEISEEEKEKIKAMTPEQRVNYYNYAMSNDDILEIPFEFNSSEFFESDKNVLGVIASLEEQ